MYLLLVIISFCCFPDQRSPFKCWDRTGWPIVGIKWLGGVSCLSAAWYFSVLAH